MEASELCQLLQPKPFPFKRFVICIDEFGYEYCFSGKFILFICLPFFLSFYPYRG